ncbi:MAG: CBS domain-containing protein [Rubripirellula sp.]
MREQDSRTPDDELYDPLSDYEPASYDTPLQEALAEESVMAIQAQPFPQVEPSTTVRNAVQKLHDLKVASLLVVEQGRLVGIFTERDVLENVAERFQNVADRPVADVMTLEPIVVYECDPIGAALAAIAIGGYRHVPVLSMADEIIGIVSPRRLFDFLENRFPNTAV